MKYINVLEIKMDIPNIYSFGIEDDSLHAYWNRGKRNATYIHYFLTGEGYFNGRKVKTGQDFLLTKDVPHTYCYDKANPWTYFWVAMNNETATSFCTEILPLDQYGIFTYDFTDELNELVQKLFKHTTISAVKSLEILMFLLAHHEERSETKPNKYVQQAKQIMEENFQKGISICEIAKKLYISDRYLYNLFIQY